MRAARPWRLCLDLGEPIGRRLALEILDACFAEHAEVFGWWSDGDSCSLAAAPRRSESLDGSDEARVRQPRS